MKSSKAISLTGAGVKSAPRSLRASNDKRVVSFLRRLARRDACARRQSADVRGDGGWHIVSTAQERQKFELPTSGRELTKEEVEEIRSSSAGAVWPRDLVRHLLSEGLVEPDGEVLRLSSSGAAFLRRADAPLAEGYGAQHQLRSAKMIDGTERVTVNECESPLGWLRNRKDRKTGKPLISTGQFEAGERLREDFFRAQMRARVTADLSAIQSGG